MTVVNPKSISGINSITTGSGSDNLLTIHTSDASSTERVRINSSGDVIVGSGITASPDGNIFATGVTTSTTFVGALTGNVTGNISGGTVAGSTGTFSGAISGTTGTFTGTVDVDGANVTLGDNDEVRLGDSGDLQLFHNSSSGEGRIYNSNAAGLVLISDLIKLKNQANNETMLQATNGGSIELYHNNIKKLETATEGVVIPSGANNCVRIFGSNAVHATSALIIGQNNTTTSQLRAYGPDSSTNGKIELRSSRGGDGSNTVNLIYDGNLNFANTYGINFSATSDATNMTSELLDDYEEGTFTPAFKAGNNSSNATTSVNEAQYTKIGDTVYIRLYITLSAHASGTTGGSAFVNGLPFTNVSGHAACSIGYFATWVQNQMFVTATVQPSSNQLLFRHNISASTATATMDYDNNLQPNSVVILSATYQTAA